MYHPKWYEADSTYWSVYQSARFGPVCETGHVSVSMGDVSIATIETYVVSIYAGCYKNLTNTDPN